MKLSILWQCFIKFLLRPKINYNILDFHARGNNIYIDRIDGSAFHPGKHESNIEFTNEAMKPVFKNILEQ